MTDSLAGVERSRRLPRSHLAREADAMCGHALDRRPRRAIFVEAHAEAREDTPAFVSDARHDEKERVLDLVAWPAVDRRGQLEGRRLREVDAQVFLGGSVAAVRRRDRLQSNGAAARVRDAPARPPAVAVTFRLFGVEAQIRSVHGGSTR